jgi:23S rRNA (pseudouridine1915-N3)-methyltransferase
MKLAVLWAGRTRDRRLSALTAEYAERVRRFCKLEIRELREAPRDAGATPRERAEREGRRLIEAVRPGEHVLVLDERGRQLDSQEFAALLGGALEGHPTGVAMIIGGPYGVSEDVRSGAADLVALSRLTLTHEAARMLALEQVYRAFTILRGGRYHH